MTSFCFFKLFSVVYTAYNVGGIHLVNPADLTIVFIIFLQKRGILNQFLRFRYLRGHAQKEFAVKYICDTGCSQMFGC